MPYGTAQPDTKGQELFRILNEVRAEAEIGEFTLQKIERDAENLLKTNAYLGYLALQAVAALRGDVEKVHCNHKRALALANRNPEPYHNYASSLWSLGYLTEAQEAAKSGWEMDKDNAMMIEDLISLCAFTGHFSDALRFSQEWHTRHPKNPYTIEHDIAEAITRVTRCGSTAEAGVQEILTITHGILQSANVRVLDIEFYNDHIESNAVFYKCYIAASTEEGLELNNKFDKEIINRSDPMENTGCEFTTAIIGV